MSHRAVCLKTLQTKVHSCKFQANTCDIQAELHGVLGEEETLRREDGNDLDHLVPLVEKNQNVETFSSLFV